MNLGQGLYERPSYPSCRQARTNSEVETSRIRSEVDQDFSDPRELVLYNQHPHGFPWSFRAK